MRLVCPNCSAQYDVDAAAVPPTGRDVQCANCAHNWFQGPEFTVAPSHEDATPAPQHKNEDPPEAALAPAPRHRRPPRTIGPDPEVLDILRQEAKREAQERKRSPATDAEVAEQIDFTKDLPQDPVKAQENDDKRQRAERTRRNQVRERTRRLNIDTEAEATRAETEAALEDVANTTNSSGERPVRPVRSNVLPNIEELNSSLRSANERRTNEKTATAVILSATSFRYGFLTACATGLLLAASYLLGVQISEAIPQLGGVIDGYTPICRWPAGQS